MNGSNMLRGVLILGGVKAAHVTTREAQAADEPARLRCSRSLRPFGRGVTSRICFRWVQAAMVSLLRKREYTPGLVDNLNTLIMEEGERQHGGAPP